MVSDKRNTPWSDAELQVAVDAYLYLLRLETAGIPFSRVEQERLLALGPLSGRNEASVRYRFRNITFVLDERGEISLNAYSPASQVGKNVKERIGRLLDERSQILGEIQALEQDSGQAAILLSEVQASLLQLETLVREQATNLNSTAGIGHNNPPEMIDIQPEDFAGPLAAISNIQKEVSSSSIDKRKVRKLSDTIAALGVKSAIWAGQRATDFSKAAAVAAGTGFGLAMSGLGEKIAETLQRLFSLLL